MLCKELKVFTSALTSIILLMFTLVGIVKASDSPYIKTETVRVNNLVIDVYRHYQTGECYTIDAYSMSYKQFTCGNMGLRQPSQWVAVIEEEYKRLQDKYGKEK